MATVGRTTPFSPRGRLQADNWLVLTDALFAERGRSVLYDRVNIDAKPTFAGTPPLYRFCPEADRRLSVQASPSSASRAL